MILLSRGTAWEGIRHIFPRLLSKSDDLGNEWMIFENEIAGSERAGQEDWGC